jgi:hypothetical protein
MLALDLLSARRLEDALRRRPPCALKKPLDPVHSSSLLGGTSSVPGLRHRMKRLDQLADNIWAVCQGATLVNAVEN